MSKQFKGQASTSIYMDKPFAATSITVRKSGGNTGGVVVLQVGGGYLALDNNTAEQLGEALIDQAEEIAHLAKPATPQLTVTYRSSLDGRTLRTVKGNGFASDGKQFTVLQDGSVVARRDASLFVSMQQAA